MDNTIQFYTISQVAGILGYSRQTIEQYIRDGKLKAIQPGGKTYRISQAALDQFLIEQEVQPAEIKS